jgi:hypothetical protein
MGDVQLPHHNRLPHLLSGEPVLVIQLLAIDVESHCRRPSSFVLVIASFAKVRVLWINKSHRYYVII